MGLYVAGFISFHSIFVLFLAVFPRLARNTPKSKTARRSHQVGESSLEEYEQVVSLEYNRISLTSTVSACLLCIFYDPSYRFQAYGYVGYLIALCLNLSLLLPLRNQPRLDIYVIVMSVNLRILTLTLARIVIDMTMQVNSFFCPHRDVVVCV